MKICKKCNSKIEDDALVCPYCGCVTKKGSRKRDSQPDQQVTRNIVENNIESQPKKRKTWLWVLGWIFALPVPLTILLLRNKKLKKFITIPVLAIVWMFYLIVVAAFMSTGDESTTKTSSRTEETVSSNIKKLDFLKDDEVTVKVGDSVSPGYLKVSVRSKKDFNPSDVVFVSENPEIADISLSEDVSSTYLYFNITGVDGGETNVYAKSADGIVKSQSIHVVVPQPIRIENIELGEVKNELVKGETQEVKATVTPSDAEDKTLIWTSSDESVATVNENGNIVAVGGGEATIKVASSNGVEASFDVSVDGTKTLMNVRTTHRRDDDMNIGNEWRYEININGERASNTMGIAAGDTLSFNAQITEYDDDPDIGTGSATYTVTEEDLSKGFEIAFDVYVTENGGRYSGQSAHFIVSYLFSPN